MPREETEVPREKGSGSPGYMPSGSGVMLDMGPGGIHQPPALWGAAGSSLALLSSPFIFRKDCRRQHICMRVGVGVSETGKWKAILVFCQDASRSRLDISWKAFLVWILGNKSEGHCTLPMLLNP